mgnify:CR=1 FL=1
MPGSPTEQDDRQERLGKKFSRILRDHTSCSNLKLDEEMVLRKKETKSAIPCQVRNLPVRRVIFGTNSANNG